MIIMATRYAKRHDTNEVPFEHDGKMLVFASYQGGFWCYNIINSDGNYRGTHQSNVKLHKDD